MRAANDLTDRIVGRLTVVERAGSTPAPSRRPLWRCRCACGKEVLIMSSSLVEREGKPAKTRSCGCLRIEVSRSRVAAARAARAAVLAIATVSGTPAAVTL